MPEWISVSALVRNVTSHLDLGYRFTPSVPIGEKDAGVLLDEITKILSNAQSTLNLYKTALPSHDYEAFIAQHKILHVQLQTELGSQREFNPELARHGRVPSQTSETKEAVQGRALDLLGDVEEYNKKVLHASRQLAFVAPPAFPDEPQPNEPEPSITDAETAPSTSSTRVPSPTPSTSNQSISVRPLSKTRSPLPSFVRSNLGLMKRLDMRSITSSSSTSTTTESSVPSLLDDPNCLMAVSHVPHDDAQPSNSAKKTYRRDISFRHGEEIITISDPQHHELDDAHVVLGPAEMFAVQDLIQKWYRDVLARDID